MLVDTDLPSWITERIPALRESYNAEVKDHYDGELEDTVGSAYFVLSFVVRPHVEALLESGESQEVQRIFHLLEWLAVNGSLSIQNELRVTMEEMDRWRVWQFLGPKMRDNEFEAITWIPTLSDRSTPINRHFRQVDYQARWREEINKIGGYENLDTAAELYIRYQLVCGFGIELLRAPEPGGEEWLAWGLPWPYTPPSRAAGRA